MKTHPYLTHYIRIAKQDKAYAWWAVCQLAKSNADHIDLPRLLTEAMRAGNVAATCNPALPSKTR